MSRLWRRTEHLARWLDSLATDLPEDARKQSEFAAAAVRGIEKCCGEVDQELLDELAELELDEKLLEDD